MRLRNFLWLSAFWAIFSGCGNSDPDSGQPVPPVAQPQSLHEAFEMLNNEILANFEGYDQLKIAIDSIGHRLTGSENGKKAEEFAYALFENYEMDSVYFDPFEVVAWQRGEVSLQIQSAQEGLIPIKCTTLAHSPELANVSAPVIDLGNGLKTDFDRVGPNSVRGKIALMDLGLVEAPNGTRNLHRSEKTALALAEGASGVILINTGKGDLTLTGTASVTGELIDIPAVCISEEDGKQLRTLLNEGSGRTLCNLSMTNRSGKIAARNVIGRITGSELPQERILIGGHLDSWDLSTGAIDNGIGSFAILEIARAFGKLGLKPRRTVEFVMFMGEEQGLLGSTHMVNRLLESGEINQVKMPINLDMSGNAIGISESGNPQMAPFFENVGNIIKEIDTLYQNQVRSGAGLHSDHQPFMLEGVPVMGMIGNLDKEVYRFYHSDQDDFELVNKDHMRNGARFTSMILYSLAQTETLNVIRKSSEETRDFLIENNLKEKLVVSGDWKWDLKE